MRVQIVILLVLVYFSMNVSSKRVAGLAVFRRINDKIEYLMLKPKNYKKEWSPPKGRLDKGEDFFAAAIRETEEETGYVADDLDIYKNKRFKMSQTMRTKLKKKTVMFWLAELKDVTKEPTLRPDEHIAYRWVTKEQAVELCKQPEFAEIMNEFDQAIQNHMS